jgi:hypothetical protein
MALSGDSPRYNEWVVVRRVTVAGFAADADWQGTQDSNLLDGAGNPTAAFQIPNLPGRPATGFAVEAVGVDANGSPVAPAAGTITFDVLEVTRYSGNYDDRAPHISDVEDPATPLTPLALALPFNLVARLSSVGGAQNQFAFRISALSAPAGATEVRILIKPLGG